MFNIKELMQHAQSLQSRIADLQDQLAEMKVTGASGGDMVTVEANGAQEILSLKIEKDLLASEDWDLLEDLIVAAVNDALAKSRELVAQEMTKLTGGIKIPGLTA